MAEDAPLSIRLQRAMARGEVDPKTRVRVDAPTVELRASLAAIVPGGGKDGPSRAPRESLPDRIGRYRILDVIGRGGMGVVYGAWDANLARPVALKVLRSALADEDDRARFRREVRIVASLQHPGIVPVHDVGEEGDSPFFTMDVVDGTPLDAYCAAQRLPVEGRAKLVAKVCDAVQHAHDRGVLHRDLKPGNVLVTSWGEPVILDFGLAKSVRGEDGGLGAGTMSGTAMGTPAYMSPEQASGHVHAVDVRSDVYSLGVVLYQIVAGRLPFEGTDPLQLCQDVVRKEPPPPSTFFAVIDRDLEKIILKAIEKDPARRYATAREFGDDLRRFLGGEPVRARKSGALYRWRKRVARNKPLSAAVAVGALALLVAASIGVGSWTAEVRQRLAGQAYDRGLRRYAVQDYPAAIRHFEEALVHTSDDPRIHQFLANALMRAAGRDGPAPEDSRLARALGEAEEAIRLDADVATSHATLGRVLLAMGRYRDAQVSLERARVLDPGDAICRAALATALYAIGRDGDALAEADAALRVDGGNEEALRIRAMSLHRLDRYEEALEAYARHLEFQQGSLLAHLNRAQILLYLARPAEALLDADAAVAIDRGNADAHAYRGHALAALGRARPALQACDLALEIEPDHVEALLVRQKLLQGMGLYSEAMAALDRVLALDAGNANALTSRAAALLSLQRPGEALEAADRARALGVNPPEIRLARAMALARLNRPDEAAAEIDGAEAAGAMLPPMYLQRAEILRARGDVAGARRDLETFLRLFPDDPYAPTVREYLAGLPPAPR